MGRMGMAMTVLGNWQLQEEELCAVRSIYGEEAVVCVDAHSFRVSVPEEGGANVALAFYLPDSYPSLTPPVFELRSDYLPGGVVEELIRELEAAFSPGEVVLFTWIEHLRERWLELAPGPQQEAEQDLPGHAGAEALSAASLDGPESAGILSDAAPAGPFDDPLEARQLVMAEMVDGIVHGEPFTEKRSTFQAHLAPVTNIQQVEAVMDVLLQNNKIRAATHNIMAYRIEQHEKGTFQQDCDDDGEAAAGGRLLHLLQMVDARDVVVVVSRWYGGTLLGPARFTHINNAARELLDSCGYIQGRGGGHSSKGKGKARGGSRK
ncbi:hypothetical protein N2152v2_007767 [Parachlorella kessleri]